MMLSLSISTRQNDMAKLGNVSSRKSLRPALLGAKRVFEVVKSLRNAITGRPLWAFVWVTRKCNQGCSHCYVYDNGETNMDFQLFQQTVDKLKELGIPYLSIFGGEPRCHPQLIDMIAYARSRGRIVWLNTDLTANNKAIDFVDTVKAGTNMISFSLDKVQPAPGNKRATSAIDNQLEQLLALKSEGFNCALHCNVTWHKENLHEGREVIEYLHKKGNITISVRPAVYPIPYSKAMSEAKRLLFGPEDYNAVKELIAWVTEKKRQGYPILNPYSYLEGYSEFVQGNHGWDCGAMRDILSIDYDGSLMQCSYFLKQVPEPFKPIGLRIQDLTWTRIKQSMPTVRDNLTHCNTRCYSPAYFCTAYYRDHRWELLKQYLRA
jgi:MoaA/NifB/PqqE/SkfB family radical SAM enzyme